MPSWRTGRQEAPVKTELKDKDEAAQRKKYEKPRLVKVKGLNTAMARVMGATPE